MKSLLLMVFGLAVSLNVFAGSTYVGKVKAVVCHAASVSNVCQVQLNSAVESETCSATSGWKYTFDGTTAEGKNMLSILLAAQVSRGTVLMGGLGCSLYAPSEELRHVYMVTD